MKELKPESLEDVIAGISLRPGPMDFIPAYIKGKKQCGNEPTTARPILAPTYGCIVDQEAGHADRA